MDLFSNNWFQVSPMNTFLGILSLRGKTVDVLDLLEYSEFIDLAAVDIHVFQVSTEKI